MVPKEELDALLKTLEDTILQAVPGAIESHLSHGEISYRTNTEEERPPFCVLRVKDRHLELCFPELAHVTEYQSVLEQRDGGSCLIVEKRDDVPDGFVAAACKSAAGS